jgi:hypothetical protein
MVLLTVGGTTWARRGLRGEGTWWWSIRRSIGGSCLGLMWSRRRGPFTVEEAALLAQHRIDTLVTRTAGGGPRPARCGSGRGAVVMAGGRSRRRGPIESVGEASTASGR